MVSEKCTRWFKALPPQSKAHLSSFCKISEVYLSRILNSKQNMSVAIAIKIIVFSRGYIQIDDLRPDLDDVTLKYLRNYKAVK